MKWMSSRPSVNQTLHGLVGTVPRCHALGSCLAIGLILATAWAWSVGHAPDSTIKCGEEELDRGDALALIEHAAQWRELYAASIDEKERLDRRAAEIAQWLPQAVEFKAAEESLLALAEETQLRVFSIQEGSRYSGRRVGVLTVSCQAQGSFAALVRFLDQLPKLPTPMACSELEMQREAHAWDSVNELEGVSGRRLEGSSCRATLFIRIPYAADQTAAGAFRKESSHAN